MKKTIFLVIVFLFIFQGIVSAEIRFGVVANDGLQPGISAEYNTTDKLEIKNTPLDNIGIRAAAYITDEPYVFDTGLRYYFSEEGNKGFFGEAFLRTKVYGDNEGDQTNNSRAIVLSEEDDNDLDNDKEDDNDLDNGNDENNDNDNDQDKSGTHMDFNLGVGYSFPIKDAYYLNASAGYSNRGNQHGYYFQAGIDFSINNFFASKTQKRAQDKQERMERLRAQYDWDEEMIKEVASREIVRGMTTQQVRESWGEPDQITKQAEKEIWLYEKFDDQDQEYRQLYLEFENDILEDWRVNITEI